MEVTNTKKQKISTKLTKIKSQKTRLLKKIRLYLTLGRGPLQSDWLENADPVMCSYKSVEVKLDLWAFQSRIEEFIHKVRILQNKFSFTEPLHFVRI